MLCATRSIENMWQYFLELVDIVSKIATTLIAGFGAWVAYQTLLKTPEQEAEPELADTTDRDVAIAPELKVFETSMQTTWLKNTAKGLECHIDERRPGKTGGHQWTIGIQAVKEILSNGDYSVNPGYKLSTGVFSIGSHRNWLYSKKLYPEPESLHFEIMRLLTAMNT
jgi:hypothetical protein